MSVPFTDLFGGIDKEMFCYNPHQFVAQTVTMNEQLAVETLRQRYRSNDFEQARYLICVGDEYGKENFVRFMVRVRAIFKAGGATVEIRKKLEVRTASGHFLSEPTYHLQHKQTRRCVIEPRLAPLTLGTAMPKFYLVSSSDSLRASLQRHFETTWAKANPVDLNSLLMKWEQGDEAEATIRNLIVSS